MTEQEHNQKTLALLSELQNAYHAKGATARGAEAGCYHRALTAYVEHLNRNGGAPATLASVLEWYDTQCGAMEDNIEVQMTLM